MFLHAKVPWEQVLVASVQMTLVSYGIISGSLIVDNTDKNGPKPLQP